MSDKLTAEQFLSDVKFHEMKVVADTQEFRHLIFRKPMPNAWHQWFEILTWQGALTIRGDMGCWTFARLSDMFEFFRVRPSFGDSLEINPSYWSEKLESESRFGGPARQFNVDRFKEEVLTSLDNYGLSKVECFEIICALREQHIFNHEESEVEIRNAVANFKHDGFSFSNTWELSGMEYSLHFLWACYAIAWAIQKYDLRKLQLAGTHDAK